MCHVLGVSRSGYYAWLTQQQLGERKARTDALEEAIRKVYEMSKRCYGRPRIACELNQQGWDVSQATIGRIMRKLGLRSRSRRKFVVTTRSNHRLPVAENILNRRFQASHLAQVWVSDITYIRIDQRWAYLTAILDLADRSVLGWTLSRQMDATSTVIATWLKAVQRRKIRDKLIFHSDRGVQYASEEFRTLLAKNPDIQQSMSRKGNCWDNAVAESFFKTLKCEWVYHHTYKTLHEAELSIFEYIECWYNTRRKHSALGYKSPAQMETYLLTKMADLS